MKRAAKRASALATADVTALRAAAQRFGDEARAAKVALLAALRERTLLRPRVLAHYHDALLFVAAYGDDEGLVALVEAELARVAAAARALAEEHGAEILGGNGIAWSEIEASLSFDLVAWLVDRFPGTAELTSFEEGGARLADTLALALPAIEADAIGSGEDDPLALLDALKGPRSTRLAFLVGAMRAMPVPPAVRDHLYDALTPFVTIAPRGSNASRTFLRGLPGPPVMQRTPLVRVPDAAATIAQPLPPPRALTDAERETLVDTARATLAMLARETDPVTWPSIPAVSLHELEGGFSLALYPMAPARRPALDSHTGYLLLRNRVPIAYGGGWPFLRVCRIGINVFPAFRGGESMLGFAQILRVYRHWYGAARFLVEPYQFGAGNAEGLRSGAFWFYWRLGFRPVDPALMKLAMREFARLRSRPGARSPLSLMRELTASDLALDLAPLPPEQAVDAGSLSTAVSRVVRERFDRDRAAAQRESLRIVKGALAVDGDGGWPAAERSAFASLSLLVAQIDDLDAWSAADKAACVALMRAKGAIDDRAFFLALAAHPRLPAALLAIVST